MTSEHLANVQGLVSQRFAAALAQRPELVAGLAFVEGAERWGERDLVDWFEHHLASRRIMPVPHTLREQGASGVAIGSYAPGPLLADLLARARARVVRMLGGMLAQPVVDAFLSAAIFAGRVQRATEEGRTLWRAAPRTTDSLSDIVLSLFVTDILPNRDFYDERLAVCVTCGRVSFESSRSGTTGCREHPLASHMDEPEERVTELPPTQEHPESGADDLDAVREAWADELSQALRLRSGWAHLGSVEVAPPSGPDTIGGYMDRHTIEVRAGRSPRDAVLEWRRTRGSRFVERAVVYANNALLLRAPPPKRLERLDGPWTSALDPDAPVVVLGSPADIVRVMQHSRAATPAHVGGSIADVRPGLAVVLSGRGVACWIVAAVALYVSRDEVTTTTLVEVRSRPLGNLRRVDVSLA